MSMNGRWLSGLVGVAIVGAVALGCQSAVTQDDAAMQDDAQASMVPVFEVDPEWPKLPNDWRLGPVTKVSVDQHDHVWLTHRYRGVKDGAAAPSVMEFDAAGNFLQGWGGPSEEYDYPDSEHNIFVDHKDNVWITGSSPVESTTVNSDDMLLKFTTEGKFLMQIGGRNVSGGNKDTTSVNKPGDLFVSAQTNEVYVADGYGNRRVIVFDAETGAFKRMWGAFGSEPVDEPGVSGGRGITGGPAVTVPPAETMGAAPAPSAPRPPRPPLDTEGPGAPVFQSPVHGIAVSNDGLVYVGDRVSRRFQVFTTAGEYVTQVFINRAGPARVSVCGIILSPDEEQRFLYIADYGNSRIVVLDRKKLEVLYQFGMRAATPGNFQGVHHLAVDSNHNLYVGEVTPGNRIQKFIFKGLSPTLPPNALTAEQLATS